jgi:hypothetical protein
MPGGVRRRYRHQLSASTHANTDTYTHAHRHADTDTYGHAHRRADTDTYGHPDTYGHADTDTCAHAQRHANTGTYGHAHRHADGRTDACRRRAPRFPRRSRAGGAPRDRRPAA